MEENILKCSLKSHKEINAISFCRECKILKISNKEIIR